VGDSVRRPEAQNLARAPKLANVRFLPFQPIERYPLLVGTADCRLVTLQPAVTTPVVPSKIVGILAAAGSVVAVLPPGDARAMVEESGGGVCVPPGGHTGAAAIRRLADDPGARRTMGEEGAGTSRRISPGARRQAPTAASSKPWRGRHGARPGETASARGTEIE